MTLPLRQRLLIVIGSVVVLIVLVTVAIQLVVRQKKATQMANVATTTPAFPDTSDSTVNGGNTLGGNTVLPTVIPAGLPVKPLTTLEERQNQVRQIAKIFSERYGTFSTDGNFENIREVQPMVTADMWKKISGPLTGKPKPGVFSSATTQVVSTEMASWSETAAQVTIRVLKEENKDGIVKNSQVFGTVDLVKQGDNWLVNKFNWTK